jgi:hypothetical protein
MWVFSYSDKVCLFSDWTVTSISDLCKKWEHLLRRGSVVESVVGAVYDEVVMRCSNGVTMAEVFLNTFDLFQTGIGWRSPDSYGSQIGNLDSRTYSTDI